MILAVKTGIQLGEIPEERGRNQFYVGVVINETLRIFTVLSFIPEAAGKLPQPIADR